MTPRQSTEPGTAKDAKGRLMFAWFAAHENQPMPEGRAIVGRLFLAIEAEARASLLAAVREGVLHDTSIDPESYHAIVALLDTLSDEQETGR